MNSHNLAIEALITYAHALYEKIKPQLISEENGTNLTFKEFFSLAHISDKEEIRSAYYAIVYTFHEKLYASISRTHIQIVFDLSLYDIREIVEEHEARLGSRMYMYRTYRSLIRDVPVPSLTRGQAYSRSNTNTAMSTSTMEESLLEKKSRYILNHNTESLTQLFTTRRSLKTKVRGDYSMSQICEQFAQLLFSLLATETGYDKSLIISRSRKREFVHCRLVFMALFKEYLPTATYKVIGSFLGKRDHTTVIFGIENHRNILSSKAITHESMSYNNLFFTLRMKIKNDPPEFLPESPVVSTPTHTHRSSANKGRPLPVVEKEILETVDRIFHVLHTESGFSVETICSKSRKREIVHCRYIAITVYLLFYPDAHLKEMQDMVGFPDHASVLHALKVHEEMTEPINQELNFVKNYWDLHGRVRRRLGFAS